MTFDDRRTYLLLRYQPRAWVEELYELVLDIVAPQAVAAAVAPHGFAEFDETPALKELRSRTGEETAVLDITDPAGVALFRDAAPATLKGKLFADSDGRLLLFSTAQTANEMSVTLTDAERDRVAAWVASHGDDFDYVFRADNALAKKRPVIGVQLKPGDSAAFDAAGVQEEVRRNWIDIATVRRAGSSLLADTAVQRLIPDSGRLGRMGRYRCTIEVPDVSDFVVSDPQDVGAVLIEDVHYDPACRRLHIGHPAFGALTITTGASTYELTVSDEPVLVRRWMKWVTP